jgi:signal transduction histidine kinase
MIALLVVLQVIVVATYRQNLEERRAVEVENAIVVGQTVAAVVEGFARDLEGLSLAAALALGAREAPLDQATAGPYLDALGAYYAVLRTIFLADIHGRVIASPGGAGIGTDLSARAYVRALQGGTETVWSDGLAGLETGEVVVVFGRIVRAPDGAPRAYLFSAFYPQHFVERLPIRLPPDAGVVLIDKQMAVLFDSQGRAPPTDHRAARDSPEIQAALRGEVVRLVGATVPFAREARFGALVPASRTGWVVGYTRPQAAVEGVLWRRFVYQAGGVTGVMALAVALVTVLAHRLARPLALLADTAQAITRGERPAVPATVADPDVAQLASAMQVMGAAVAEREARLRALAEVAQGLAEAGFDAQAALETASRRIAEVVGDACVIRLLSADGQHLDPVAIAHRDAAALARARALLAAAPRAPGGPADADIAGRVLQTGQPVLLPAAPPQEAGSLLASEPWPALERLGVHSILVVPLRVRGRTIGTVAAARDRPGRPHTPEDRAFLQQLADHTALAIENARLYSEVEAALRTRDSFLSSVAHDLKSPLAAIKGNAQLLQRQLARRGPSGATDQMAVRLAMIDATATRMTRMLNELLDLTRLQMGRPLDLDSRPTDLVALARQIAAEYQQGHEQHQIRVEAAVPELIGAWDEARLERVLRNLVGNAIKYSPEGGEVALEVAPEDGAAGPWAVVVVQDHGVGIPAGDVPHIFERFRRGQNVAERISGTGIGLASARQIVQQHGGTIAVVSQEGHGSTFTVRLPLPPHERTGSPTAAAPLPSTASVPS